MQDAALSASHLCREVLDLYQHLATNQHRFDYEDWGSAIKSLEAIRNITHILQRHILATLPLHFQLVFEMTAPGTVVTDAAGKPLRNPSWDKEGFITLDGERQINIYPRRRTSIGFTAVDYGDRSQDEQKEKHYFVFNPEAGGWR